MFPLYAAEIYYNIFMWQKNVLFVTKFQTFKTIQGAASKDNDRSCQFALPVSSGSAKASPSVAGSGYFHVFPLIAIRSHDLLEFLSEAFVVFRPVKLSGFRALGITAGV